MSLGDITNYVKESGQVQVPDLDWLVLEAKDIDNIPTDNNVRILPQLQEAWAYNKESSLSLVPNQMYAANDSPKIASSEDIQGVVDTAKKEMMKGLVGSELVEKLSGLYPQELIKQAKEELVKISQEQGLLGNVYIDISPFDSCAAAAKTLGSDRIRMAKYVLGTPKRHVCSSHSSGVCKELRKKVVASMEYDQELLNEYSTHLKMAGIIEANESVKDEKDLRNALLKKGKKAAPAKIRDQFQEGKKEATIENLSEALDSVMAKESSDIKHRYELDRFSKVKPVLAFIQNEMLKGKIGNSLKESVSKKFSSDIISEYKKEIQKVASLQGLLGNVYVDISYFNTPEEAVRAIKTASTNPLFLIQTVKAHEFDNTLDKIAKATGCQELPKDGSVGKDIAFSYLSDLNFSSKISSEATQEFKNKIEAGENVLKIIRDAFLSSTTHKKTVKEGGVPGYFVSLNTSKEGNRDHLKTATTKAIASGISIDKIKSKLSEQISTPEAEGLVCDVIATINEVDANVLTDCTVSKYRLAGDAIIIEASKCKECIYKSGSCLKQGYKFASTKAQEIDSDLLKIDPKTAKAMLSENPDAARNDINQEYDVSHIWGSGNNIALETMGKHDAVDVKLGYSSEGMDVNLNS